MRKNLNIPIASPQEAKMVAAVKPLALNAQRGKEMADAVSKSGKKIIVWFE
jgi:hypothetical protein